MTIRIVNVRREPDHVYCGRGSPLGNPFKMDNETMRNKVCEKYEIWFQQQLDMCNSEVNEELDFITELAINGDVNLGCFCAPRRCHCETIKKHIDSIITCHGDKVVNRIIIAGGRDFNDSSKLSDVMDAAISNTYEYYHIISGMARGADALGVAWAESRNIPVKEVYADWDTYGKSAGYRRNVQMSYYASCLIAFWDGKSSGTKHMIDIANKKRIPVHIERY